MKRPRILITRTRQQGSALAEKLDLLGAETVLIPTIEVVAPTSFAALDAAVSALANEANAFDWLVFTSANAVQVLAARARQHGAALHPGRLAAIGPTTAKAVEKSGIFPQSGRVLLPAQYVAESLANTLLEHARSSSRHFLLVRAEEARDVIPTVLEAAGHRVTIVAAYRSITPPDTLPALQRLFSNRTAWPDVITFTSSSTAQNLTKLLTSIGSAMPAGIALASIGPITSATLRELGYQPTFEAEEPTIDSLTAAIAQHLGLA